MEQKMSLQQAMYLLDGFNLRENADQFDNKALNIGIECIERCLEYEKLHQNNTWISVKDKLPTVEVEVLVYTKRKTITTAMYEDGTVSEKTANGIGTNWDIGMIRNTMKKTTVISFPKAGGNTGITIPMTCTIIQSRQMTMRFCFGSHYPKNQKRMLTNFVLVNKMGEEGALN